jgi:hypothetical protein
MLQDEVERLADEDEGKVEEGWAHGVVLGLPVPNADIHIRLDADTVDCSRPKARAIKRGSMPCCAPSSGRADEWQRGARALLASLQGGGPSATCSCSRREREDGAAAPHERINPRADRRVNIL